MTMELVTKNGKTALVVDSILFADIESDGFHERHPEYQVSPEYPAFLEKYRVVCTDAFDGGNTDRYQGTHEFMVIADIKTGQLYGVPQWQGGGKYGELYREENGSSWGFEGGDNPDYDPDSDEGDDANPEWIDYYAFVELVEKPIMAYTYA